MELTSCELVHVSESLTLVLQSIHICRMIFDDVEHLCHDLSACLMMMPSYVCTSHQRHIPPAQLVGTLDVSLTDMQHHPANVGKSR